MVSLARLNTLLVAGVALLASGVACSSGKSNTPGGISPAGGSGGTAGASGGTGGSSASGGTGGTAGGSGGSAGSSGGAAGTDAGGGSAGASGNGGGAGFSTQEAGAGTGGTSGSDGGIPPADQACTGEFAFWATGAAFTFPTPKNLGLALGALTYDYSAHPVTIVLRAKIDGSAQLAASATETQSGGFKQAFPTSMKPTLTAGTVSQGGFATDTNQDKGWLAVTDQSGTKYIEIDSIQISASTSSKCGAITGTLTGIIPSSAGSVTLDLPSGSTTVASLASGSGGGPDGGVTGWNVRMLFTGESTDFDFTSL